MGANVRQHTIQHVAVTAPTDQAGPWIVVEHATHRPVGRLLVNAIPDEVVGREGSLRVVAKEWDSGAQAVTCAEVEVDARVQLVESQNGRAARVTLAVIKPRPSA